MKREDTTITGGPTLFDNVHNTPDGDKFDAVYNELTERCKIYAKAGMYSLFIPEELKPKAKEYFCNNAAPLRKKLIDSGATPDVIDVVLSDYARLLCGVSDPAATPQQMIKALKAVKPIEAFFIDRLGLYLGLFLYYISCQEISEDYVKSVRSTKTATTETKIQFINKERTPRESKIICWLLQHGVFAVEDWLDVTPDDVTAWIIETKKRGGLSDYLTFYLIAKNGYLAPPQVLEQIPRPPIENDMQISIVAYAETATATTVSNLQRTAETFGKIVEEQKAEQEKARQAAKSWEDKTNSKVIELHETPNIICSRPVEISTSGQDLINTLPIQKYIDEFCENQDNAKYGVITTGTINRVVTTINLLPNFLKPEIKNGWLVYHTTLNELSWISGYKDAGQAQQMALLGGFLIVTDRYFLVNRPYRVEKVTNAKGREVKRLKGGPTATRLVAIDIETTTGGIDIKVSQEAYKGSKTLISQENFKTLNDSTINNLAKQHFIYQTLTKGHKSEYDLVTEVFGYKTMLDLSKDDAEAYKRAKKYISGHRSDDTKKLASWFVEFKEKNILDYKYNETTKVYSWRHIDGTTSAEDPDAPDEQ